MISSLRNNQPKKLSIGQKLLHIRATVGRWASFTVFKKEIYSVSIPCFCFLVWFPFLLWTIAALLSNQHLMSLFSWSPVTEMLCPLHKPVFLDFWLNMAFAPDSSGLVLPYFKVLSLFGVSPIPFATYRQKDIFMETLKCTSLKNMTFNSINLKTQLSPFLAPLLALSECSWYPTKWMEFLWGF